MDDDHRTHSANQAPRLPGAFDSYYLLLFVCVGRDLVLSLSFINNIHNYIDK